MPKRIDTSAIKPNGRKPPADVRRDRLAAQLRANLKKRKAQARGRADGDIAQRDAGPDGTNE